MLKLLFATEN